MAHKLFDRIAGGMSYLPSTMAGCAIMAGTIAMMMLALGVSHLVGEYLESSIPVICGLIASLAIFIAFMRFARTHS